MDDIWFQLQVTSAACIAGGVMGGGFWGWAVCNAAAGAIYDHQFQTTLGSYGICFNGCGYPGVSPH